MTLKLLPIGNKTVLRDSRILSVVEKWSSEIIASSEQSSEVAAARAESADVMEDMEQEQEGSGTETREENNGSDGDGGQQSESVSRDDLEISQPLVSTHNYF